MKTQSDKQEEQKDLYCNVDTTEVHESHQLSATVLQGLIRYRWWMVMKSYVIITMFYLVIYHSYRNCDQSPRRGRLHPPDVGSCTWTNRCRRVSAPKCKDSWTSVYNSDMRACPFYLLSGCLSGSFIIVGCWSKPPGQREGKCIVLGLQ